MDDRNACLNMIRNTMLSSSICRNLLANEKAESKAGTRLHPSWGNVNKRSLEYSVPYATLCSTVWTVNDFPPDFEPRPFKHSFRTSNFTSTILNCFALEHRVFKTKQLRSVLVKLLVLNECLNGRGLKSGGKLLTVHTVLHRVA